MFNQNSQDYQRSKGFRKPDHPKTDVSSFQSNSFGVTTQMMTVINAQNILIMKLLQRQSYLSQQLNKRIQGSDSASGSSDNRVNLAKVSQIRDIRHNSNFSSSSNGSYDIQNNKTFVKIIQKQNHVLPINKLQRNVQFSGQINSSQSHIQDRSQLNEQKPCEKKKQTQTKNMVKNFAKAIFHYIRKNKSDRDHVMKITGISQQQFFQAYQKFKGKIHSISELRTLWTSQGNQCHKAYRMLSLIYLRKHCLERTFNSRVENYSVHLKYRQRLLQGLQNPQQFTALKTN